MASIHPLFDDGVHHVFAYGSLIWRPGFEHCGAQKALLHGAHRRLCIYSHRYRGTPEQPGLVFGLSHGGSCHGLAFEVEPAGWEKVKSYLWEREMIGGVYRPAARKVTLEDGQTVAALTFVVQTTHQQYAGHLPLQTQAELVRSSYGSQGPNIDYVVNTAKHLAEMGIEDKNLVRLSAMLSAKSV